jgi:hypothetical protein
MTIPLKESYSIDLSESDFIHIRHEAITSTGRHKKNGLWFERQNVAWVLDTLRSFVTTQAPMSGIDRGHDSLEVFEGGHEGWPLLLLSNSRPDDAVHGGYNSISISKRLTETLLEELAAIRPTIEPEPPRRIWRHEYALHESHTSTSRTPISSTSAMSR